MSQPSTVREARIVKVEVSVEIARSRDAVWNAFTEDLGAWWTLANFLATGGCMTLELHAGGRLFERNASTGHELLWANVLEVLPRERLFFKGFMGPPYARAAMSLFAFNFTDSGDGTRVSVLDHLVGDVDEDTQASVKSGWTMLLDKGLKAYLERLI